MATEPSLFGGSLSPQEMQNQLLNQRASSFAQLTPDQQLGQMAYKAGSSVGTGLAGAFGVDVQDPMIKRATKLRELSSKFDTNTPEGLLQMANALRTTDPEMALQIAQKAKSMELEGAKLATEQTTKLREEAQTNKYKAEEGKILRGEAKDEQLRSELSSLPMDAQDKDVEAVVRKYGKPDDIFKTLERKATAEANRIAKTEQEREKATQREQENQRNRDFKQQMLVLTQAANSSMTSVQRELAQQRLSDLKEKQADKGEKKEAAKSFAISHANKVVEDVAAAKSLVSGTTTGLTGKAASYIPGSDSYNLNQRLLTIKANLGFDRLQQMREASPTGGALGQVAVQELQALQATVGSMELGQSREELSRNLDKIDLHYNNWLNTMGAAPKPAVANTGGAAGVWSIKPKQ